MNKRKNMRIATGRKVAFFVGCALCIAALPFGGNVANREAMIVSKADRTVQEANNSYVMSAVSDQNSVDF